MLLIKWLNRFCPILGGTVSERAESGGYYLRLQHCVCIIQYFKENRLEPNVIHNKTNFILVSAFLVSLVSVNFGRDE